MKRQLAKFLILILFFAFRQTSSAQSYEDQAVLAAPEALRANATIYGFDQDGNFKVFRIGTNQMICLGDDPTKDGFSVAAYHKELDPFMARGRELKNAGKSFKEIFEIREQEVKSKSLAMPDKSTLIVLTGAIDESGELSDLNLRYVFYIPFATPESTGLPTSPLSEGGPWIMDPGTHRAHIMITPSRKDD